MSGFPKVAGRCPACGHDSLALAAGDWVTCMLDVCPNPTAVADILDVGLDAYLESERKKLGPPPGPGYFVSYTKGARWLPWLLSPTVVSPNETTGQ